MMPLRTGKIWNTVTVVGKELTTTPSLVCKDCGHPFCGGNTRIVEHILNKCTCSTSELQALRTELLTEKEAKAGKAAAKAAVTAVNAAAESKPIVTGALPAPVPVGLGQMGLGQMGQTGAAGAQDTEGEGVSGLYAHYSRFRGRLSA